MNAPMELLKLPPHSVEAEQAVLGALLIDNASWDTVADLIAARDFYTGDHQKIFEAVNDLIAAGKAADVITVSEALEALKQLDQVGGLAYLGELANGVTGARNIRYHAQIVKDRATLRALAMASMDIGDLAYNTGQRSATDILNLAQSRIMALGESVNRSSGFEAVQSAMKRAVDGMGKQGTPTGFVDLDQQTGGMGNGDLIVVAGRPSMGKTAFVMNIAENVALKLDKPVGIFSLEMPSEALAARLLTSHARVNNFKFRKNVLGEGEWARMSDSLARLQDMPIHIDETGAISPTEVRARARRLSREVGGLGLVIIDYLQLMDVDALGDSRADSVGRASRDMKHLAKELNCPVMLLSQLNRSVEQRPNKRPNMADLRDSGAIEQDADVILFIYRDEVYNPDSPDKGMAEINIAKQRNGPIGTVRVTWIGEIMRFENRAVER